MPQKDCIGLQICGLSPLKVSECTLGESILAGAAILVNAFRERFIAKFRASCPGAQFNDPVIEEIERLISSNLKPIIEEYNGNDEKRQISLPAWIIGSQARRAQAGSKQQIMTFTKFQRLLLVLTVRKGRHGAYLQARASHHATRQIADQGSQNKDWAIS